MNRFLSFLNSKASRVGVIFSTLTAPFIASAQAAVAAADPFDTALATVTSKVTSYAGALVGVAAIAVVFMVAVKYVKKLPKAS